MAFIALQNLPTADAAAIADLAAAVTAETGLRVEIENFAFRRPGDNRGALLNRAVKRVQGRYLAFLDYDDIVYPNHAAELISDLEADSSGTNAASFCGCTVVYYDELEDGELYITRRYPQHPSPSVMACLTANCFPIHSYIIDRHRLHSMPRFNENTALLEDYYFLLMLFERHRVSTHLAQISLCEYWLNNNDSNTVPVTTGSDAANNVKRRKWDEAEAAVEIFKHDKVFIVPYADNKIGLNVVALTRQSFLRGLFA
jgi:glycosyltransferase involved in cell wall biosynthesis